MSQIRLFEEHKKLMFKKAWYYAKRYNLDFNDLKSQAFLVFCEALERFQPDREVKFSTYLFHRLRTLNDYCISELKHTNHDELLTEQFSDQNWRKLLDRVVFNQVLEDLSQDGKRIIKGILEGEFDQTQGLYQRRRIVGKNRVKSLLNWPGKHFEKVWNEVKTWWAKNYSIVLFDELN